MTNVPILTIKNIHTCFGKLEVLHGISLTAKPEDLLHQTLSKVTRLN